MAERTHIPGSPACGEWETLLADALDGLLSPTDEAKFTAHKAVCPACAALYEEARKGREWLKFLSPEPEPPAELLEKILAKTGPGHKAPMGWTAGDALPVPAVSGAIPPFVPPVWQQPGFLARIRASVQPRHADDGGNGVLFNRADTEPGRRAVDKPAAGRFAAEGDALANGAAIDHGFGADRAVLRPPAVCV